ncbi:MAG: hypothetical protein VB120_08090 [Lachnospiraceae bacterium]|nr:hypothetical protein [Lachnospiraceae bacterium]
MGTGGGNDTLYIVLLLGGCWLFSSIMAGSKRHAREERERRKKMQQEQMEIFRNNRESKAKENDDNDENDIIDSDAKEITDKDS